jgi:hypothetical protein
VLSFEFDDTLDAVEGAMIPRQIVFQKSSESVYPSDVGLPGNHRVHLHAIGFDSIKEAYPRNITWSEFPVVVEPAVAFSHKRVRNSDFLTFDELAGYWNRQNYFLVDAGAKQSSPRDQYLLKAVALSLRDKFAPGKTFAVRSGAEDTFCVVEEDCMKIGWADWKFHYCYKLNFRAVGFEVMRQFVDTAGEIEPKLAGSTRRYIEVLRDRWTNKSASVLDEPLALQVLFAIEAASRDEARHAYGIAANFEDSSKGYSFGGRLISGNWVGTGKYEPQPTNSSTISNYILSFVALGFVDLKDEAINLTNAGSRFLAALHKINHDPDATLRFASSETGVMELSSQPNLEEWLLRFFRKMKQKVTGARLGPGFGIR